MKPLIGITRGERLDDYVASIEQAGGAAVVLDPAEDPAVALAGVGALLLTGGADVDPARYGQAVHPTTDIDAIRDRFEIPIARAAVAGDVPLLAICRGIQVLNVAAGGTLVQDLPSLVGGAVDHAIETPKDAHAHDVRITPDSRLTAMLGGGARAVNSRHHQAIDVLAPTFVATAAAADGVIEAIERPEASFCLGVQWHPENFWRSGEFAALFEAFVRSARR
ncbi:MAG TPA: gamma-glutamyl-gamma-aminobutyrate hydrolase family protein [Vicinamibacterales bacterium]|nr:gamma-glutamyl-gamma-aminobutyrate hydrolase family protein [Vicinamibacterales bacterium]